MNMQMLEYFLTVTKEKSISKAANKLFVSQPALSKQISKLEERLGFSLFIRSSNGVRLTNKGKELYNDIEPLFRNLQYQLEKHIKNKVLRMGSDPLLASYYYPDYMQKLLPYQIHLTKITDDTIDLIPLLESGEIDAAIIQDHPSQNGLYSSHLFSDEFYAAVPITHPLTKLDSVSIIDCFKYTQLLPPSVTPLYKKIKLLMDRHTKLLPEIMEMPYHALIGFVAQGYGISYLPSIMVRKIDYKGVVFIPLKETPLKREMYLYTLEKDTLRTLKLGFDK